MVISRIYKTKILVSIKRKVIENMKKKISLYSVVNKLISEALHDIFFKYKIFFTK